ncbi:MAG: energy transducer TonB [Bacteroidia bacterium]|jgi:TonB family protein|nr:energy transducer TonB [Bacteroidia bacterium]
MSRLSTLLISILITTSALLCHINVFAQADTTEQGDIRIICGPYEQLPEFPGGQDGLTAYLNRAIHFPKIADTTISGTVIIEFTIDTVGNVGDAKIFRSLHPAFDSVALEAVRQMPRWKTYVNYSGGSAGGRKESVTMRLPIRFSRRKE